MARQAAAGWLDARLRSINSDRLQVATICLRKVGSVYRRFEHLVLYPITVIENVR